MKCPHCQTEIHGNPVTYVVGPDKDGVWAVVRHSCPACSRMILFIVCAERFNGAGAGEFAFLERKRLLGYPRSASRPPPPSEVPEDFAADYREAAQVLSESAKASAALSRRCLQHVLRSKAGVKANDLAKEIDEVLGRNLLPSHLAEAVDAVRNIGNFAAHPMKSKTSGEVLPVEPGEAEWTLDVLDGLFDFFFVQPEVLKKRRAALDAKLAAAGKPPMK